MKNLTSLKTTYLLLVLLSAILVSSCITPKKINYLQKPSSGIPEYTDSIGYEEYELTAGDKLMLRVFSPDENINTLFNGNSNVLNTAMTSNSDFTDLYAQTIQDDGTITIPIIGKIVVGGYYLRDAKRKIEYAVQSVMKDRCAVDLKIVGRYFSVIGGGSNGKYPIFREKMNIFQALAMAGDISTYGDRSKIKILREAPSGTDIKVFDVRSKDIINSEYFYIQPNDVIYIQDVKEQFLSVTSFGSALSTLVTTISFGVLVYNLATPVEKKANETETANP